MRKKKASGGAGRPAPMRISAAAAAAGVSTQTVEYYILLGLLVPVRDANGRRHFNKRHVERIRLIRRLNRSGYTLCAIREVYQRRLRPGKGAKSKS